MAGEEVAYSLRWTGWQTTSEVSARYLDSASQAGCSYAESHRPHLHFFSLLPLLQATTRLISSLALLVPLALSVLRHHRQPRTLIDVCVYIDGDPVISKLGVLGLRFCDRYLDFAFEHQDYTSLHVLASILDSHTLCHEGHSE